jgi:type-2 restriction enzyme apaLI
LPLTTAQSSKYQAILNPGSSAQAVRLTPDHVRALIYIAARDTSVGGLPEPASPVPDLFDDHFDLAFVFPGPDPRGLFELALTLNEELETYVACLATIHKFRLKYRQVLSTQPFATMDQVGPRALLQFRQLENRSLAALLVWRKWLYDIDNRAAQDTGYLFEPVISAALGGASFGARNSPVRRLNDPSKGRQIDCVIDDRAYEIKIRVTIAASGQGRWHEELTFPNEAKAAGFVPVLVVLDPTDNPKLAELVRAYRAAGGECYLGDAAWEHLRATASPEMGIFLERYIHAPLDAVVDALSDDELLPELHLTDLMDRVKFEVGDDSWEIPRNAQRGTEVDGE